jgi:hypothetical protein
VEQSTKFMKLLNDGVDQDHWIQEGYAMDICTSGEENFGRK